jgi:hypothetical protein
MWKIPWSDDQTLLAFFSLPLTFDLCFLDPCLLELLRCEQDRQNSARTQVAGQDLPRCSGKCVNVGGPFLFPLLGSVVITGMESKLKIKCGGG